MKGEWESYLVIKKTPKNPKTISKKGQKLQKKEMQMPWGGVEQLTPISSTWGVSVGFKIKDLC